MWLLSSENVLSGAGALCRSGKHPSQTPYNVCILVDPVISCCLPEHLHVEHLWRPLRGLWLQGPVLRAVPASP